MAFELKQEVYDRLKETCIDAFKNRSCSRADEMINLLMDTEGVIIHCPYHHFIVPAVLLTMAAMEKYVKEEQLRDWLEVAEERAKAVPGGVCGNMGNCGSSVGAGIFMSVYTNASPLSMENWKMANELTGNCLLRIASYGGPRCCKRTCYLALMEAIPRINRDLGLNIKFDTSVICKYSKLNKECLHAVCPFHETNPRNTAEGYKVTVPEEILPSKVPNINCECRFEPIIINDSDCYIHWTRNTYDFVRKDEPICEAEVDKKLIEFTAPVDGYLTHLIEDGDHFRAGTVIGVIRSKKI